MLELLACWLGDVWRPCSPGFESSLGKSVILFLLFASASVELPKCHFELKKFWIRFVGDFKRRGFHFFFHGKKTEVSRCICQIPSPSVRLSFFVLFIRVLHDCSSVHRRGSSICRRCLLWLGLAAAATRISFFCVLYSWVSLILIVDSVLKNLGLKGYYFCYSFSCSKLPVAAFSWLFVGFRWGIKGPWFSCAFWVQHSFLVYIFFADSFLLCFVLFCGGAVDLLSWFLSLCCHRV